MLNSYQYSVRVFWQLMLRDWYVFLKVYKRSIFNFGFCVPIVLALGYGYLIPYTILANPTMEQATIMFAGCILWALMPLSFSRYIGILFDLEHDKFINYQQYILNARWLIVQKTLFNTFLIFLHMSFFYPISKLLLGIYFDTSGTSWLALYVMLLVASLFCSSWNMFVISFVKNVAQTKNFWLRVNFPLMQLGGFLVPWSLMYAYSAPLGLSMLLNPFVYITEGLRRAITGNSLFFPYSICIVALVCFSIVLTGLSFYFFKKKIDHI